MQFFIFVIIYCSYLNYEWYQVSSGLTSREQRKSVIEFRESNVFNDIECINVSQSVSNNSNKDYSIITNILYKRQKKQQHSRLWYIYG
jgi:hypothetical protein